MAHDDLVGRPVVEDLVGCPLGERFQPLEAGDGRGEVDERVVRCWPRTALVAAPRRASTGAPGEVRVCSQDLDLLGESVGQEAPGGGQTTVGPCAGDQGLCGQNTAVDLVRSRQRDRTGKPSSRERVLGVDGGLSGFKVYRGPVRFDDHGTTVS